MSGKNLTVNTNESLMLWQAVMFNSTVSFRVAFITCGPSICGGKVSVMKSRENCQKQVLSKS